MIYALLKSSSITWLYIYCGINPLIPKSDQHLISPYSMTLKSNIKVMRMEEMITN